MATIKINGSEFAVQYAGASLIQLTGKRGGMHTLVKNVNSGRWIFLRNGVTEERIRSAEGLAL